MFLKEVGSARGGKYGEMIEKTLAEGLTVSGIWHLFAYKPEMTQALSALTQAVMRGPSALSEGQRELIAAYTSSINQCAFCYSSHVAVAAEILGDESLVRSVCTHLETSAITNQEKALLHFSAKITKNPSKITINDIDHLKACGWSEEAIYDTIMVVSLFNFYNRWNDANGTPPMSPESFSRSGKRIAEKGY